jgi:hypothetical protein
LSFPPARTHERDGGAVPGGYGEDGEPRRTKPAGNASSPPPDFFERVGKVRYNPASMVQIVEKIDKAVESKCRCTLMDKMGRYFHGTLTDSWVRLSGGKLRGKIKFTSSQYLRAPAVMAHS